MKGYYDSDSLETYDVIKSFNLGFELGNVIKYCLRAGRKTEDPLPDLTKALVYLCTHYLNCENKKPLRMSEVKKDVEQFLKNY